MGTSAGQDRLDAAQVRAAMSPDSRAMLRHLSLLQEVDSTNSAVLRLPRDQQHAHAVLAESQSRGRGRRERSWHSPPGGNIYMSLGWNMDGAPLAALPLAVGVCLCRALERAGLEGHGIKWPNDVLVGGAKLAGILLEAQSAGSGPELAVIGVGINVRMPRSEGLAEIDRPWTDLDACLPAADRGIPRNQVAGLVLDELLPGLARFKSEGFEAFRASWDERDLLRGEDIRLEGDGEMHRGVARGVRADGGLVLQLEDGETRVFHFGEAGAGRG